MCTRRLKEQRSRTPVPFVQRRKAVSATRPPTDARFSGSLCSASEVVGRGSGRMLRYPVGKWTGVVTSVFQPLLSGSGKQSDMAEGGGVVVVANSPALRISTSSPAGARRARWTVVRFGPPVSHSESPAPERSDGARNVEVGGEEGLRVSGREAGPRRGPGTTAGGRGGGRGLRYWNLPPAKSSIRYPVSPGRGPDAASGGVAR